jgi:hypothetical protein
MFATYQENQRFKFQVMVPDIITPVGWGKGTATVNDDIPVLMSGLPVCKGKARRFTLRLTAVASSVGHVFPVRTDQANT